MEKKTSSEVWNFFSKDAKNSKLSLCRLCGKRYKNGGGTSNLRNHILRKHQNLQLSHLEKRQNLSESLSAGVESNTDSDLETSESDSLSSNKSDNQNDDSQSSVSMDSCNTFYRQATLNEMFRNQASFEVGGSNDVKITEALVYMICKDNLPFHSTEKKGMRFFFKSILPRYQIPSRKTITRRIEDKYAALNIVVRKNLSRVNTIAFTTDIAIVMNATRSFLVYTVHYIDKEACAIKSISLGVKDLTPHHTAEHISKDFEAILESWDLSKNKIISVTTDNGANIVAGVNLLLASKNKHVSCLAHNINFVVTKALGSEAVKDFVTIIMKVKTIVAYFKHSITAQDDLRAEQRKEGKTDGTFIYLKQEVPTRWNSTFYCLERFLQLSSHVAKILSSPFHKKGPSLLEPTELGIIEECLQLLRPFEEATKDISGENYVSASLIIPLTNCIRTSLNRIIVSSFLAQNLKKELLVQTTKRLDVLEANLLLSVSTLLDPRFKKVHFLSPINVAAALNYLKTEINNQERDNGVTILTENSLDQTIEYSENIWNVHNESVQHHVSDRDNDFNSFPTELKLYLNQPLVAKEEDPIKYWINFKNAFPFTFNIAMKYLIVQGSSVASERLVSLLNNVCTDQRNRLTPNHINQLVFLGSLEEKFWHL